MLSLTTQNYSQRCKNTNTDDDDNKLEYSKACLLARDVHTAYDTPDSYVIVRICERLVYT
jgi:hypothetical protein